MSVFFRGDRRKFETPRRFPSRASHQVGSVTVTADSALKHSAAWAALRLRADLISAMPVNAFRKVGDVDVKIDKPAVLVTPGGAGFDMAAWMWATQFDLDRLGNSFGLITERDGSGLASTIELQDHNDVVVTVVKGVTWYRIRGTKYPASDVWHERQYRLPGQVMGLSAISLAASSVGLYQSAQQFGIEWFSNGGTIPSGHLRNKEKTLTDQQSDKVKERFKLSVADRDVFVTGNDWEYSTVPVAANEAQFLTTQDYTSADVARVIGVPGDLIDLASKGSSITYANITQRNLQFLIMNLWAAIRRRQVSLSTLVADPRYVRLSSDAILQMDPQTKAAVLGQRINDRMLAPSEARRIDNLEPFTTEQLAEFDALFVKKGGSDVGAGTAGSTKSVTANDDATVARNAAELIQKVYLGVGPVITESEARDLANRAGAGLTGTGPSAALSTSKG